MEGINITDLLAVNLNSLKNKPDLQSKLKEFQDALKILHDETMKPAEPNDQLASILSRLNTLDSKEVENSRLITSLKYENLTLKKRIDEMEGYFDDTESRFIDIEKSVTGVEQYTRRENFEISGIPTNLPHNELKAKVINITNSILERPDNPITSKDIHACHRLKTEDGKASVIVRMVNREDTVSILKSKKKLPDKSIDLGFQDKLYINENLCNSVKDIYKEARKLKKKGLISSCWTYNGVVHIKKRESDSKGKKIFHLADFENHFSLVQLGWEF